MTTAEDPKKAASNLPSTMVYAQEDQGGGFENVTREELSLPFLSLLQSNSPECDKTDSKYIEGAAVPGMFNSATKQLYNGEKGIIFVPCARRHVYVEFKPRQGGKGGGYVDSHEPETDIVKKAIAESKEFGKYKAPNGNDLVETREVYGYTLDTLDAEQPAERLVIAFSSTKMKVYKQFMATVTTVRGNPPMYAFRMLVRSVPDKNAKGQFRNFGIKPAIGDARECMIPPTSPLIAVGREIKLAVAEGLMRADHASGASAPSDDADGGGDKVFG